MKGLKIVKELEYDSFSYEGENVTLQNALNDDGDLSPLYDRDRLFCPECEEAILKFTHATKFRRAFLSTKQEANSASNKHALDCSHAYDRATKKEIHAYYKSLTQSQIEDKLNAAINRFLRPQRCENRGTRPAHLDDNPAIIRVVEGNNSKHLSVPTKNFSRFHSIWEDEDAYGIPILLYGTVRLRTEQQEKQVRGKPMTCNYLCVHNAETMSKIRCFNRFENRDAFDPDAVYYVAMIALLGKTEKGGRYCNLYKQHSVVYKRKD